MSKERFQEMIKELIELYERKCQDYGGESPLSPLELSQQMAIEPWKGVLIRMTDPFARIMNFAKPSNAAVKPECVSDSLMDISLLALLARERLEISQGAGKSLGPAKGKVRRQVQRRKRNAKTNSVEATAEVSCGGIGEEN